MVAKYADGCLQTAQGSLDYITSGIKTLKEKDRYLEIITLIFPEVNESIEDTPQRTLFSGTIDEVGSVLRKEMGVNHVIFGLMDPDSDRVIDSAIQLSKYAK